MAVKKSQLYSTLWEACNALRGGMDASQYKDYVLVVLFLKYISDKAKSPEGSDIEVPDGCSFYDIMEHANTTRINEMMKFAQAQTIVTERAITTAGFSCAVTANAEHTPRICTSIGLSLLKGPKYFFI